MHGCAEGECVGVSTGKVSLKGYKGDLSAYVGRGSRAGM